MWAGGVFAAPASAQPVNAAHAQASGEGCDQCGHDRESNRHDNQQRETCEQHRNSRLQDRVDYGDDCVEKDHLAIGR